ncbi:MAG TPA: diphosphate--fructose-6-phosphate 1-phosphotransferase [bacterium]|nr:diphosphate--fructose-6-phosphate 1-phosphotransferase [bacterium]
MRKRNYLKGKAILAQSGGCTAVINQSLIGAVETALDNPAMTRVLGSLHGVEGLLKGQFVDMKVQSRKLLQDIRCMPSAALGSSRRKLRPGEERKVLDRFRKSNVRYLFMIGGNDTAETILRIANAAENKKYALRVIHIPKTIDNDLMETDHCPGYGSAARFAAITTQEAALDTRAMRQVDPVKMIELMGRNSGWIVAASALLKRDPIDPPHLLLLPEIPFEEKVFLRRVEKILSRSGYCVIVMSETIRDAGGKRIGARTEGIIKDPFGHPYVESPAAILCRLVESRLKVRARFDKPGTIQRMSIPYVSGVDQQEAYEAGQKAVQWAIRGVSKVMVCFVRGKGRYRIDYKPVPLEKIPGRERYLPASFLNHDKTMITPAFVRYALPLIGKGLPAFPSLNNKSKLKRRQQP